MNDDVESVLNELIETSIDGEKGFFKAAEDAHDAELKSLFTQGARRCREGIAELQSQVRAQGARPEASGSAAGALHRGWISIREAVELQYWCKEFSCTESELTDAMAKVGEHVAEVRQALASQDRHR